MKNKKIKLGLILGTIALLIGLLGLLSFHLDIGPESTFLKVIVDFSLVPVFVFIMPYTIFCFIIFKGYYAPPPSLPSDIVFLISYFVFYFVLGYLIQWVRERRNKASN